MSDNKKELVKDIVKDNIVKYKRKEVKIRKYVIKI